MNSSASFFRRFAAFLFLMLIHGAVVITPARAAKVENMPIKLTQPDGNIVEALVTGDEFYRSVADYNGYSIVKDAQTGYFVYALPGSTDLVPSAYIVGRVDPAQVKLTKDVHPPQKTVLAYRNERLAAFPMPVRDISSSRYLDFLLPTMEVLNNIVIFVRFSDESEFTDPVSKFEELFNNMATGANSLRKYYREASYDKMDIRSTFYPTAPNGTVVSYKDAHTRNYYRPYTADNTVGYATNDERNARCTALLKNAALYIESQIPDTLDIDRDNDGNIDDICYMFSGTSDAWRDLLWPCCGSLSGDTVYIKSKRVWTFNMQFRDWMTTRSVGVLSHEMFHALGAPDLYHYTEDKKYLTPASRWDLMESDQNPPQHMTAYMKWKYGGWISSIPEIVSSGTYTLKPLTSSTNNCYKIASPNSAKEFFVVEYRNKTGTFEGNLPGTGLIVYRINTDCTGNAGGPPDELYIFRPGGSATENGSPLLANLSSSVKRTKINDSSDPKSLLTAGGNGGLEIANVSYAGDTISFQVGFNQAMTPTFSPEGGIYASATAVTISCATPNVGIRYTTDGSEPTASSTLIANGGTVTIGSTKTLKAKAWSISLNTSFTRSAKYAIQDRAYVDADSPGPELDGMTWATAFHRVQDAIDAVANGSSVWVAAGTYYENLDFKNKAIYGGFDGTETSNLSERNIAKNVTVLDGGGTKRVINIQSNATCQTRVEGFTIQNGLGLSDFGDSTTGGGIAISYTGEPRIGLNIIKSNQAEIGAGIFIDDGAKPYIFNNLIVGNTGTNGAGIGGRWEFSAKVIGNTIVNNTASANGGGIYFEDILEMSNTGEIKNNLISGNNSGIYKKSAGSLLPSITYNCLYGNVSYAWGNLVNQTGSNGNNTNYPSFVNSSAGDYRLMYGSSCIDSGSNVNPPSIYDREGSDRVWDGNQDGTAVIDIGAYEFRRVYVDKTSPSSYNGSTWAKAYHSVQQGINASYYGDEVWVAADNYFEHITLKDAVKVYGGFAGNENYLSSRQWWKNKTVLDGSGTTGSEVIVPAAAGPLTCLDGFVIQNGNATTGGGMWCGWNSSAKISNNIIGPNSATYGAGIFSDASKNSFTNNVIAANTATDSGGGLYLYNSNVNIAYNTIVDNTAATGGAVCYSYGDPVLSSNIIAFNSFGVSGTNGTPSFNNCNVYGNTNGNFEGMTNPVGGSGNMAGDPMFADRAGRDYHLTDGSPCIDAAKYPDNPLSDLDGRGHAIDGNADGNAIGDIGAYEYRRIYVDQDSSAGYYDGSTWNTAYHTITNALNLARPGDEIWVAGHIYTENVTLGDGVALYGGYSGVEVSRLLRNWKQNVTVMDGGDSGRVITVPAESRASTRIDGFTIQNGKTQLSGGGIYIDQQSQVHVKNNRIVCNKSEGINSAAGGGVYSNIASPTIMNNIIAKNSATGSGLAGVFIGGGACIVGGNPVLTNNTIVENSAGRLNVLGEGGSLYLDSTDAVLKNNIVAFNDSGIFKTTAGAPILFNNNVFGNSRYDYSRLSGGATDISYDPLFAALSNESDENSVGNYHLLAGSYCIDRGSNTGIPSSDADGNVRPIDGNSDGVAVCDIGAYESPIEAPRVTISSPSASTTTSGPIYYTLTYKNAAAITLTAANLTLSKTGTASGTIALTGSGLVTRKVTISNITGSGTLGISVAAGTASNSGGAAYSAGPSATFAVTKAAPTLGSVNPSSGSSVVGAWVTFTATYSDADGYADLSNCGLLVNNAVVNTGALHVFYDRTANKLYMKNETGTIVGGIVRGTAGTIETENAKVDTSATTVISSGNTLTINWKVQFKAGMAQKACNIYLMARDVSGLTCAWTDKGDTTPKTNAAPTLGTVSPNSGKAVTGNWITFSATYSDANGTSDLSTCSLLINYTISNVGGLHVYYDKLTNKLYMKNNAGTVVGGVVRGTVGSIQTENGLIDTAGTTVTSSGNILTINWKLQIKPTLAGNICNIYLMAKDMSNMATAWTDKGDINPMVNAVPTLGSVTPNSGKAVTGNWITFSATYSDANGTSDLSTCSLLINNTISNVGGLHVYYDKITNKLYMKKNAGTVVGGVVRGTVGSIQTENGLIDTAGTTVTSSGNTLTINWKLQIKPTLAGKICNIYLMAKDISTAATAWTDKGDINPMVNAVPTLGSVTPNSGVAVTGNWITFSATYSDANGTSDLSTCSLLINNTISNAGGLHVYYNKITNKLYMKSNAGTVVGGVVRGTVGSIQTENGLIDTAGTTVTSSGNTLTINWKLQMKPTMAGKSCNIYLFAQDIGGLLCSWTDKGDLSL